MELLVRAAGAMIISFPLCLLVMFIVYPRFASKGVGDLAWGVVIIVAIVTGYLLGNGITENSMLYGLLVVGVAGLFLRFFVEPEEAQKQEDTSPKK